MRPAPREAATTISSMPDPGLERALQPLLEATGGAIVGLDDRQPGDIVIEWNGEAVLAVRLPHLDGALARLVAGVERELGAAIGDLSREQKQRAVALLHERGAFTLRKSVEDVAEALGVSRFTVYNYLDRMEAAE